MRVRVLGRQGVWALGKSWSFSYWPPRTWHPLGIRLGWYGHRGWWGAAAFRRRDELVESVADAFFIPARSTAPEPCGDLDAGLVAKCIRPIGHDGDHQGIARAADSDGLHSWPA